MLEKNGIVTRSAAKRRKIEEEQKETVCVQKGANLLNLSDDVLLMIFSYVKPHDLLSLSKCCERVSNIICDRTLWEKVDLRSTRLTTKEVENYTRYLQKNTKFFATRGHECFPIADHKKATITKDILKNIVKNAPNLETLILENHAIDCLKVTLEDFPPNLAVLRFVNCQMVRMPIERSYFYKLDKVIQNLKILDLTDCIWFVPHTLLALSKSAKMEELILKGCNVSDCMPYTSLAANFGFTSLKTLDLRNTNITDSEVSCFNRTMSLRNLYLSANENEDTEESLVTDYGVFAFGGRSNPIQNLRPPPPFGVFNFGDDAIIIQVGNCPRPACHLESLILRNYPGITDRTLVHVQTFMLDLRFLDVSNTGVTAEGVQQFKQSRPDVKLITTV